MARILVIDDDHSLREVVRFILDEAGHEVLEAGDGESGLALLERSPDLVMTDVRMPGIDGMEVLRRVREDDGAGSPPVVVLTAHGTVEQAVEAMRLGAFTYLLKPFARDELLMTVDQALHVQELEQDNARLRDLLQRQAKEGGLIHASSAMADLLDQVRQVAASEATVLITGESGTGKELVARACHDLSPRWDHPFVAVSCGALPADLMESELFGHERGAFTGADRAQPGRIRGAEGGTLFLDEIGELPLPLQPKLLRVLETRQVDPLGGREAVPVDFRLVCASNRDLAAEAAAGHFRTDLFHRLDVIRLHLPPLRERPDDVPILWDHFTRLHAGQERPSEPALVKELMQRTWPGNVRELKNLNQRLVLLSGEGPLRVADLERHAPAPAAAPPMTATAAGGAERLPLAAFPEEGFSLADLEKEVVRRALARCDGNRTRAAAYLGIPRHVLVYRITKYDLG